MSNDMVFGMRLTYDGQAANAGLAQTRDSVERLGAAGSKMAGQYSGLNQAVKEHSAAVTDTDRNVNKLLDRYDPLGAKLRQLQADFKALDAAAASGRIAGRDDARVDAVYARLQKEIAATSASTVGFAEASGSAARSAGQLRMATQQLPMQFTDIWVSLAAGQSPMMVLLQQGSQIKDSFGGIGAAAGALGRYMRGMVNPITLVTAALAAGVYAWSKYENVAVESAEKTMDALQKAIGEGRRLASMDKKALDEAIADAEAGIRAKEALVDVLKWDPNRRFSWKAATEEEAKYNAEIERARSSIVEMKRVRDALGDGADKLRDQSTYARRESLAKEIALLEKDNAVQQAGSREYLANLSAIADRKKQLADMDKKGQAKEPGAALAARIEAEAFKAQMEAMGVAAAQIKVYEMARRGAKDEDIKAAQAAAEISIALDAQEKSTKESAAAWDESSKAIDKARTASSEYLKQLEFETSLMGLSTLEVQKRTKAREIEHALEKKLLDIRNNDTLSKDPAALKAAEDAARQAAEATKAGAAAEIEARNRVATSWEFGSKEAIRKYDEQVKNSAAQAESLYSKAFKGAEDAVTRFMMSGKADIRDFANAVIEEFYRIKVAQPMVSAGAGMLGDLFGAIGGAIFGSPAGASASTVAAFGPAPTPAGTTDYMALAGMRASGGPVDPNSLYRINERGPELLSYGGEDYLMMGGRGGYVKPLSSPASVGAASAAPSVTVNVINAPAGTQVQQRPDGNGGMTVDVLLEQIEGGIARNVSRGTGALSGALTQTFGLNRAPGAY